MGTIEKRAMRIGSRFVVSVYMYPFSGCHEGDLSRHSYLHDISTWPWSIGNIGQCVAWLSTDALITVLDISCCAGDALRNRTGCFFAAIISAIKVVYEPLDVFILPAREGSDLDNLLNQDLFFYCCSSTGSCPSSRGPLSGSRRACGLAKCDQTCFCIFCRLRDFLCRAFLLAGVAWSVSFSVASASPPLAYAVV